MSIVQSPKIAIAAALCCFALLGAGRYRPQTAGAPDARPLFSRPLFTWPQTRGQAECRENCPDAGWVTDAPGKLRTPGGLSFKRQECYDNSYRYRLKKRRCCQLLRGESYYDPDPPYDHPTHGYHETLWRRFPDENLISGECLPEYEMEVMEETGPSMRIPPNGLSSPAEDGEQPTPLPRKEQSPGRQVPPVVSPPSPMPPEGSAAVPSKPPFAHQPVIRYSASQPVRHSPAGRVQPVTEERQHFITPAPASGGQQPSVVAQPSLTLPPGIQPISRSDAVRAGNPSGAPPREFFAPPAQPIRRISHNSEKNLPLQSSPGWHPRRK